MWGEMGWRTGKTWNLLLEEILAQETASVERKA